MQGWYEDVFSYCVEKRLLQIVHYHFFQKPRDVVSITEFKAGGKYFNVYIFTMEKKQGQK